MAIEKFTIARNDDIYECFPYICRSRTGRIILTYRESNGHVASEFCRLIVRVSDDAGNTWSEARVIRDEDKSTGVLTTWRLSQNPAAQRRTDPVALRYLSLSTG